MNKTTDTARLIIESKVAEARGLAMRQFAGTYVGDRFAIVIAVRDGLGTCANRSPIANVVPEPDDIIALKKAMEALGLNSQSLLIVDSACYADEPKAMRLLIETVDPFAIVALDRSSFSITKEAFNCTSNEIVELSSGVNKFLGYTLIFIDGFEQALKDPDAKREAWNRLKYLAR